MAGTNEVNQESESLVAITARDIMFECPACGKSLVVDEAAAGLIVDCPKCQINVIVPPKTTLASATPPAESLTSAATADTGNFKERLAGLGNQLKELQTQRTEINNRIAARLNELNRDLVLLARLETSQQKLLGEWQQAVSQLSAMAASSAQSPVVVGSSVNSTSGRSRVQFDA